MAGKDTKFASISVVEPLPTLMITMAKTTAGTPVIQVEGISGETAVAMDWGAIIDIGIALGKKIFGGGNGGGGATGCTTIKITNPDGSSTEIKQCPAPG
jgi:hypothetical protein